MTYDIIILSFFPLSAISHTFQNVAFQIIRNSICTNKQYYKIIHFVLCTSALHHPCQISAPVIFVIHSTCHTLWWILHQHEHEASSHCHEVLVAYYIIIVVFLLLLKLLDLQCAIETSHTPSGLLTTVIFSARSLVWTLNALSLEASLCGVVIFHWKSCPHNSTAAPCSLVSNIVQWASLSFVKSISNQIHHGEWRWWCPLGQGTFSPQLCWWWRWCLCGWLDDSFFDQYDGRCDLSKALPNNNYKCIWCRNLQFDMDDVVKMTKWFWKMGKLLNDIM